MKCPNCQAEDGITEKKWMTDSCWGDWMGGELLFWVLIVLLAGGVIGWAIDIMIIALMINANWHKRLYECNRCGNRFRE